MQVLNPLNVLTACVDSSEVRIYEKANQLIDRKEPCPPENY